MRPKLQEQRKELLALHKGLILFSAAPGNGLRSTTDVALHVCDRYVREFAAVEEESNPYQPVENVPVTTRRPTASPTDVLPRLFRTEPNVVVVRDLVNAQTVGMLCEKSAENRLIISTVRAKDCAEALLRVLVLGVPPAEFAKVVAAVVGQRLVRKLCDACKEAYAPTPQILKQLGIPEGRVQAFYRPPQPNPEEPKEPCQVCGGIGYLGRTEKPSTKSFAAAFADTQGRAVLDGKVTLLHCTSEYPAPYEDVNLRAMDTLRKAFGLPVGLSDHSPGINVAIAAAARGAVTIEKHFTLDRTLPGPDHKASLEPGELKAMVEGIRQVERALGDGRKTPTPSEIKNIAVVRKCLVARRAIQAGETFSEDNLAVKRAGGALAPDRYWDWLGRTATRAYAEDEAIEP